MDVKDPVTNQTSLVERVKNILLKPKEEWPRIDAEPASISSIFTSYVLILAAIPAIATLIGGLLVGYSFAGTSYRPAAGAVLSMAIVQYVLSLVGVVVLGLIIDWLAPTFGGTRNRVQAFKVAAYASTAAWLAGIFAIIPSIAFLGILGLYSLYLLYVGLPLLMKAPAEKAISYTVVTVIAAIVLWVVMGALASPVGRIFGGGMAPHDPGRISGTVTVPGVGSVDVGKMEAASREMEKAAARMEQSARTGTSAAIAPATLQAMLPASIGAYRRVSLESQSMGAAGVGGSHAQARYEAGDNAIDLEITDMAAVAAIAAMGAAMNVEASRQTDTGYEKTGTVDGRLVSESWDRSDSRGSYSMTIANRFLVQAQGKAASIAELKAAVAAIGVDKLEKLAG